MDQRQKLKELVIRYCNEKGSRTFSMKGLNQTYGNYANIGIGGKTPQASVRRLLQELREDDFITFLDNSGNYTLRGIDLLESEKQELKNIDISREEPIKREYLIETYVRKTKWAREAREVLGTYCLFNKCKNTFLEESGTPYIEVHHIVPLCEGGEDGIWNLSVLCAHHHRMAHFSDTKTVIRIEEKLLKEVSHRI